MSVAPCVCQQVRRPAQFTYLSEYNLSLKELGTLVNSTYTDSHISYCVQCRDGGELLCCDGCPAAYHAGCLGLHAVLQDAAWYCPSCVQVGPLVSNAPCSPVWNNTAAAVWVVQQIIAGAWNGVEYAASGRCPTWSALTCLHAYTCAVLCAARCMCPAAGWA